VQISCLASPATATLSCPANAWPDNKAPPLPALPGGGRRDRERKSVMAKGQLRSGREKKKPKKNKEKPAKKAGR
jgi:hypothetical protein